MDLFRTVRLGLEKCSGEVFKFHRGALYENPSPRRDFPSDVRFLIEPEVHADVGGERPLRDLTSEIFVGSRDASDQIILANGGTNALWLAFMATRRSQRSVVHALTPYWMYLPGVIEHSGGELREVSTLAGNRLASEAEIFDSLVRSLGPQSASIYLATPTNPIGNIFSSAFIERVVAECEARDLYLIVDHAYYGFTKDDPATGTIAPLPPIYRHPRVVSAFTFSKLFGIPGLRLGFVYGAPDLMRRAADWYHYTSYTPNSYSQSVVHQYLKNPVLLRGRQEKYKETLAVYQSIMDGTGPSPDGGFFSFLPPQPSVGIDALLEAGIGVLEGVHFGAVCDGWVRVCFTAEPPARLERGLTLLRNLLRDGKDRARARVDL